MTKQDLNAPPQSIEAEQSVLGGIMMDNGMLDDVDNILNSDSFYKTAHQKIYSAMIELSHKGEPIDIITLNNHLKKKNMLENVGDTGYLAALSSAIPTAANCTYYAEIVNEKAIRRKIGSIGVTMSQDANDESTDVGELVDKTEQALFSIGSKNEKSKPVHHLEIIKEAWKSIEASFHNKQPLTGIPSGFTKFDDMTGGLQNSDLIVLAGRPSMGKTALALNIARNAAIDHDKIVVIFSLEMSKEALSIRMLCTEGEVDSNRLRTGRLRDQDFSALARCSGRVSESTIFLDDKPAITANEIRSRCRSLKREHGLDLIIVDYLQLMGSSKQTSSREQDVSGMSRNLKALAKELKVPVIALSQLNRALESRDNKRPKLSDIRESGAIEQDADIIGFVYRDEVYKPDTDDKGIAELIIGKQRNGGIGTVRLKFEKKYTKFSNLNDEVQKTFHDEH